MLALDKYMGLIGHRISLLSLLLPFSYSFSHPFSRSFSLLSRAHVHRAFQVLSINSVSAMQQWLHAELSLVILIRCLRLVVLINYVNNAHKAVIIIDVWSTEWKYFAEIENHEENQTVTSLRHATDFRLFSAENLNMNSSLTTFWITQFGISGKHAQCANKQHVDFTLWIKNQWNWSKF